MLSPISLFMNGANMYYSVVLVFAGIIAPPGVSLSINCLYVLASFDTHPLPPIPFFLIGL